MFSTDKDWIAIELPGLETLPRPVYVRANQFPANSYFPSHSHAWDQLVYASFGVLIVKVEEKSFIVPPEQAVWLPAGQTHSTYSLSGAVFRSLYIDPLLSRRVNLSGVCRVISASTLIRELILKAAEFPPEYDVGGYEGKIIDIMLEEIARMPEIGVPLPWPQSPRLRRFCEQLYENPTDQRSLAEWGSALGASSRTLARHLERETGLTFRQWRHRLRLFKALEYLGDGENVTNVALMLGYRSTSAFIYMFRREYGCTPLKYFKQYDVRKVKKNKKKRNYLGCGVGVDCIVNRW